MGGAQSVAANALSAVVSNPAALARIKNTELQLGLSMNRRTISSSLNSSTANGVGEYEDSSLNFSSLGIAIPVPTTQGSLVLGLGYHQVKNFTGTFQLSGYDDEAFVTDTEVWGGDFGNETVEEGGLDVVSFAAAMDVSPNVSLGLALDIWTGSYSIDKRYVRNDTVGGVSWLDLDGGDDNISAWSLKPSVLYFTDNVRVGAYARLPMTFHIEQDNYQELYSANDGYYFTIHETIDPSIEDNYTDSADRWRADYKIKVPMELAAGIALGQPGQRCIAFDVSWENWTEAEFKDEYDPYYFRDSYRNTVNWGVGLEHALPMLNSVVRLGYRSEPSNFKGPRDSGGPYIETDNDRDYITCGWTANMDSNLRFDLGYAHGFWREQEGYRTDEDTRNLISATLTYRIPAPGSRW